MLKLTHSVLDVCIICSDFEESLRFYHEFLGLEIALDVQIGEEFAKATGLAPGEFRQVRVKAGDTLIKLVEIASPPSPRSDDFAAGVRWLTFFVEDINKTCEELKNKGVQFLSEPVPVSDTVKVVCAKAPDGILIEFVQT